MLGVIGSAIIATTFSGFAQNQVSRSEIEELMREAMSADADCVRDGEKTKCDLPSPGGYSLSFNNTQSPKAYDLFNAFVSPKLLELKGRSAPDYNRLVAIFEKYGFSTDKTSDCIKKLLREREEKTLPEKTQLSRNEVLQDGLILTCTGFVGGSIIMNVTKKQ